MWLCPGHPALQPQVSMMQGVSSQTHTAEPPRVSSSPGPAPLSPVSSVYILHAALGQGAVRPFSTSSLQPIVVCCCFRRWDKGRPQPHCCQHLWKPTGRSLEGLVLDAIWADRSKVAWGITWRGSRRHCRHLISHAHSRHHALSPHTFLDYLWQKNWETHSWPLGSLKSNPPFYR